MRIFLNNLDKNSPILCSLNGNKFAFIISKKYFIFLEYDCSNLKVKIKGRTRLNLGDVGGKYYHITWFQLKKCI